jgi:hypothetical protein
MTTKVNFAANRKKAEDAGLLGGSVVFKVKEGMNVFRLVSECLEHPGSFNGKPTFKWLCLILDRTDGQVKPYFMPNAVYEQIEALQLTPGWAFDEVPMPYDITLNVKNAGKLDVNYTVIPSPNRVPLTVNELEAVNGMGSIREYQKTVYENQPAPAVELPNTAAPWHPGDDRPLPPEPPPTPDRYSGIPEQYRPRP